MSFVNSLLIALLVAIFSLLLGLPLAILITRTNLPFRRYIKYLYLIPIFIPPAIITITWMTLIGNSKWLYSLLGSVFILTLCYFPFVTLLSIGGLKTISRDLEEAARLSYNELGVLRRITIPYASNHILCGTIFVFIFAISNYEVPALLGVKTFPVEIFAQFSSFYNMKLAFLYSIPLVAVATILVLIMGKLMSGKDYIAIGRSWREPTRISLGKSIKTTGFLFVVFLLSVSIFLPLTILLKKADGFNVYNRALRLSSNELLYSLFWAFVGATTIVFLSFLISYILTRKSGRMRNILYYISILPFAIPATVCGIALIKLFNRPCLNFLYSTPLILLTGYVVRFSPFAIRILDSSLKCIDKSFEEEATIEGAGVIKRLFLILAPLLHSGLMISWIVVFALIMGEIGLTVLVIPPGCSTLILKIYTLMHYGSGKLVAGLAVISIMVILMPIAVLTLGNKIIKPFFISALIFLFLALPSNDILYAQEKDKHIYSTWDVLELDTCASAWLIKRFVDHDVEFKFYPKGDFIEEGIPFDTPDAEFRRTHNMSTFESILQKYNIKDPRLIKIGKIIHSIEVDYWAGGLKPESEKINGDIMGMIKDSETSQESFVRSFAYFDNLYASM